MNDYQLLVLRLNQEADQIGAELGIRPDVNEETGRYLWPAEVLSIALARLQRQGRAPEEAAPGP